MKIRINGFAWTGLLLGFGVYTAQGFAHEIAGPTEAFSNSEPIAALAANTAGSAARQSSGQGAYRFEVFKTRDILPEEALAVLEKAHGGFAVDRRDGKGEIYFTLPGAGLIRVGSDLQQAGLLATDPGMKATNLHNTTLWYGGDGIARLVFPANDAGKVFTTTLDGTLIDTLDAPTAETDFDPIEVKSYFREGGKFVPTDVEYLNHVYFITTGYSSLDYVLTSTVNESPFSSVWNRLAFGGKGDGPGKFQTGHGITVSPDGTLLDVADRPLSEIDRYTPAGVYQSTIQLPEGSFPCDIDYLGELAVVPCLHGPDRDKGAPIYILKEGQVVSTIMPKEELGLERFQHVHNAVLTSVDGTLYIVAQAWNPGDFVVLRQVND